MLSGLTQPGGEGDWPSSNLSKSCSVSPTSRRTGRLFGTPGRCSPTRTGRRGFPAEPIDGYAEGSLMCLIDGVLVTPEAFEAALNPLGLTVDQILARARPRLARP